MWFAAGQEPDLETNPALRWMRKHLRLLPDYAGNALSVKRDGVRWFTPLFAVLILIAVTDVIFARSEEHTSELQSQSNLVCRLLLEKKKKNRSTSSVQRLQIRNKSTGLSAHR